MRGARDVAVKKKSMSKQDKLQKKKMHRARAEDNRVLPCCHK